MKKLTLCLLGAFISLSAFAQSTTNNFDKIAILPFEMLGYPDADEIKAVQYNIEDAMAQLELPSEILSSEQTSAIFHAQGINKDNIHSNTVEDLAIILGADAILIGEINTAASNNSNLTNVIVQLVDGNNGQVVWKAEKEIAINDKTNELNEVMTASSAKFPK